MKKDVFAQIFDYEGHKVRLIERDEKAYWVLADVCEVIGLTDPSDAAKRAEPDEPLRVKLGAGGQTREMLAVNEPGLYRVIMRSDKPDARKFQRWVFHDILPSIMGRNKYVSPQRKKFNGKVKYLAEQLRAFGRLYEDEDIEAARERLTERFNELINGETAVV